MASVAQRHLLAAWSPQLAVAVVALVKALMQPRQAALAAAAATPIPLQALVRQAKALRAKIMLEEGFMQVAVVAVPALLQQPERVEQDFHPQLPGRR